MTTNDGRWMCDASGVSRKLWDFTALDCLERCEEEFVRRYIQHKASPFLDGSAHFGTAVHAGVAVLYAGGGVEAAQRRAEEVWVGVVGKGFGNEQAPAARCMECGAAPTLWASDPLPVTPACPMCGGGIEPYWPEKPYLRASYVKAVVAMYAELQLAGPQSVNTVLLNEDYLEDEEEGYCGIVDRGIERPDGSLVIRDLKTTGLYIGDKWADQWKNSAQPVGYMDLAEKKLGRLVNTFWVDAVHVDRRGYPKEDDFHAYGPYEYSPARRDEMRRFRRRLIVRANALVLTPEDAAMRTHSCFRFNTTCALLPFCAAEPGVEREDRYEMALATGRLVERQWKPEERDVGVVGVDKT